MYMYMYMYIIYRERYRYIDIDIDMVFTTVGFFEVAIESWPEWDLNPRPLNSIQML